MSYFCTQKNAKTGSSLLCPTFCVKIAIMVFSKFYTTDVPPTWTFVGCNKATMAFDKY